MDLKKGDVIDNNELVKYFECSPQGGMRYSKKTNSLVLVSNHIKSVYEDKWIDNVIHYTGMGQTGNQSLDFRFNKHLAESNHNGISLFLFEVFKTSYYTFQGAAELISKPYQDLQLDANNKERSVWVFPLRLMNGDEPITNLKDITEIQELKKKQARKTSISKLKLIAEAKGSIPSRRVVKSEQTVRNPYVREYALKRAKGFCQLCENQAPFKNSDGSPFLEVHHIHYLRDGGSDSIDNVAALCPNCHRKMHIIESKSDIEVLLEKAKELL